MVAMTVSMPIYGKLGDLYGRRRLMLFAIVVFTAASLLCGLAQSMGQLVLARVLQGVGAGGLMAVSQAIIGDIVPRARPLPGLLQQHVRHRQRRRPGARRPAHRVPVVALGVLDQPADRPSRAGHLAADPGRPAGAAPATGDRLPGHRADGGGSHRAAPGHHPDRPGRSLERPGAARPVRPGGARPAAVRRPGAALPRTAGADATVRRPRRHPQLAGCVLRQLPGHLADRAGAAALPERYRRRRRQRRAAFAAAGHGPAAGRVLLRAADRQPGTLQAADPARRRPAALRHRRPGPGPGRRPLAVRAVHAAHRDRHRYPVPDQPGGRAERRGATPHRRRHQQRDAVPPSAGRSGWR